MRSLATKLRMFGVLLSILATTAAHAGESLSTMTYAVTRDGEPIGSTTVRVERSGDEVVAQTATRVQVKIAYITVYRFEQRQTEHWVAGKLKALDAVTDDNGSLHKVTAARRGNRLAVVANGKASEVDPAVIPANLWNASLIRTSLALDPKDGSLTPVSVVDRGIEQLVLRGRPTRAHRYSIKTSFPQEVWYDEQHRLLKVELRGSDGSTIRYLPG